MLPNPEDVSPLKALIAYDALVHSDHPLRKKGIDGIELFIGMSPPFLPNPCVVRGMNDETLKRLVSVRHVR